MLTKDLLGGGVVATDELYVITVGTAGGTGKRTGYGYRSGTSDDAGGLQPTIITINNIEYTIIELMGYTSNTGGEPPSTWMRLNKNVSATLYVAKENQTAGPCFCTEAGNRVPCYDPGLYPALRGSFAEVAGSE